MVETAAFDYVLPERLIADQPVSRRDASRLMVVRRDTGTIEHRHFRDLPALLEPGDCLVLNDTRVIPVRLVGEKQGGGGARIEVLLLEKAGFGNWLAIASRAKRLRPGTRVSFAPDFEATVVEDHGGGLFLFHLRCPDGVLAALDRYGEMPVPPYIERKRAGRPMPELDRKRYQTVYASREGSAAAPTAGLHFTDALLDELRERGIRIARVTLHIGLDTFRPVLVDAAEQHPIHSEWMKVGPGLCNMVRACRKRGGRVVAVGTSTTRALEKSAADEGLLHPTTARTDLFILPGYRWKAVDAMVTNFHLPRSTLLMMIRSFMGKCLQVRAYAEAVEREYRFYSYGDAMLIL